MNNWTFISVITITLNNQNHISENVIIWKCNLFIYFDWSPIRLHGEGGVYDLYYSQPPGGDQRQLHFEGRVRHTRVWNNTAWVIQHEYNTPYLLNMPKWQHFFLGG